MQVLLGLWTGSIFSGRELSTLFYVLYIGTIAGTPVAILRGTKVKFWQRVNGENK